MLVSTWFTFFLVYWTISLLLGVKAIASMSCELQYGFAQSYRNALGLQIGLAPQIATTAVGVDALLVTSALASSLIKWFGVTYLVYLAVRQWQAPLQALSTDGKRPLGQPLAPVLCGFLASASNPKAVAFVLAVLPQFIDPCQPLLAQYLVMGGIMIAVGLIVMTGYTGLAARVLCVLHSPRQQKLVNCTFASLFVGATGLLVTAR